MSRPRGPGGFRGWQIILGLVVVVSIVAGLPYAIAGQDARRPPIEEVPTRLELPAGVSLQDLERGRVYEVIDGDTIDVELRGTVFRVRYFGVDTPERGQRCYREALDRNLALVKQGNTVYLLPDERDNDGARLLRYVFLEDGTSVDATLAAEGFAHAWTRDGRYRDQIIALEQQAKAAGRGCLWGSGRSAKAGAPGPMPAEQQRHLTASSAL